MPWLAAPPSVTVSLPACSQFVRITTFKYQPNPGSQIFGRRFSIIVISFIGAILLYPYSFTGSKSVIAAAFFEQFCVQGAWGIIPIHLMELSPGSFRTCKLLPGHNSIHPIQRTNPSRQSWSAPPTNSGT